MKGRTSTMKITLNDLMLAESALLKLFFVDSDRKDGQQWTPRSGKTIGATMRIGRLAKICLEEMQNFHTHRTNLWRKYGTAEMVPQKDPEGEEMKDEKGETIMVESGKYNIPKENVENYIKEEADLLDTAIEIPDGFKIKQNDLDGIDLNWRDLEILREHFLELEDE